MSRNAFGLYALTIIALTSIWVYYFIAYDLPIWTAYVVKPISLSLMHLGMELEEIHEIADLRMEI